MGVDAAVYNILKDNAIVSALVATRIAPNRAAEAWTKPYCVYHVITGGSEADHTEGSGGLARQTVQVDCVDDTSLGAKALADGVVGALHCYTGLAGSVYIDVCHWTDQTDIPIDPFVGDEHGERQVSLDFDIFWRF